MDLSAATESRALSIRHLWGSETWTLRASMLSLTWSVQAHSLGAADQGGGTGLCSSMVQGMA